MRSNICEKGRILELMRAAKEIDRVWSCWNFVRDGIRNIKDEGKGIWRNSGKRAHVIFNNGRINQPDGRVMVVDFFDIVVLRVERDGGDIVFAA